eukprot:3093565-Amphidinium_carterae.1
MQSDRLFNQCRRRVSLVAHQWRGVENPYGLHTKPHQVHSACVHSCSEGQVAPKGASGYSFALLCLQERSPRHNVMDQVMLRPLDGKHVKATQWARAAARCHQHEVAV